MQTTQNPKILIAITKASPFGGAQRYVFDVASAAKDAGLEVEVAFGSPGELSEKLRALNIEIEELSSLHRDVSLVKDFTSLRQLVRTIKMRRPDVLHLNSSKMGLLGGVAGRVAGVPRIIFTAHGWAFNEGRPFWQKGAIAFLHYLTVVLSHETLCNSEATRRDIAWMPFVQRKIRTIRLGVAPIKFLERNDAREKLLPGHLNNFWVGMLGELHKTKGVFEAVEGFKKVCDMYPDARLVIMGEGDARNELEKQISSLGLSEKVLLLGHITEAPRYLLAFDIFLFPSRTEALGLALLEAGLAGLPSIGTHVGGIPEIIEHRKTGILIPSKNSKCIQDFLMILMKDVTLRRKLGEALRQKVTTSFSKEEMLKKTIEAYRG